MKLEAILIEVETIEIFGNPGVEVATMAFDSRQVSAGTLFFAVRGTLTDGHDYIHQAVAAGAVAVICEEKPEILSDAVTYVVVADASAALGYAAAAFYHHPSQHLTLVGITGTNGKTTIATLLFRLFRALGYKVGLISTVENQINQTVISATHTTPNPIALNELLLKMVDAGCDYCFMEVSSHAVVQQRIAGLTFAGGVFSNITHDHLDFHETFANYINAKKGFFDGLSNKSFALTNTDDKNGMVMLQNTAATKKTYALRQLADFKGNLIGNKFSGLQLDVDGTETFFRLVGAFNAYNLLAVYGTAMLLGQDKLAVLTAMSELEGAEGRFDFITAKNQVIGVIDYAHTPDAVQNVLSTINDVKNGTEKVITVIGCGGDRDKTKRPIMARVACDWSDKVILTSDNPRTEDPLAILAEMQTGVSPTNLPKTITIADRREAIKTAWHLAQPGDIILVAGKGHEKYQEVNGKRQHFDDKEVLTEQFNQIS